MMKASTRKHCVRWLAIFAIWTILGLVDAGQGFFFWRSRNPDIPNSTLFIMGVIDWWSWALFTPLIVWLAVRFPMDQAHWGRLILHAVVSILISLSLVTMLTYLLPNLKGSLREPLTHMELFEILLVQKLLTYVLIHWMVLGIAHGVVFYARYRQQQLQASQLETRLAQARLQMLKMQLHPHFLFNTLHAISALMHKDIAVAERMIARLGCLLRATLENTSAHEVRLSRELDLLELYLDIERTRLADRLTVNMSIAPETYDAAVPNLLLQPLVENAVRHGIATSCKPGHIEIHSKRQGSNLILEVHDTGPGLNIPQEEASRKGVGLSNTLDRLEQLYGDKHTFEMKSGKDCGLIVSIQIPFRELTGDSVEGIMGQQRNGTGENTWNQFAR